MYFHTFGDSKNPSVMLIHGGGEAWWNYLRQARMLEDQYYVIIPTLDGHGEERGTPYVSTENSADKLMAYIDAHCGGRLFALCGVSLGGQIVCELLSRKPELAKKAIIDGSICYPQPAMAQLCMLTVRLLYKFMFSEKACRKQLRIMEKSFPPKMHFPLELQNYYLQDLPRLPKQTLWAIYRSYMAQYALKASLANTKADVMYWYGEKEMNCVKKSAKLFKERVPSCRIYEAKGYNHGYLSVYLPDEWMELALPFFEAER